MNLEEIYRKETELLPASMDEKGNLYYYEKYVKWLEEKVENLILCEVSRSKPSDIQPILDSEKKCKAETIKDYYIIDEETFINLTQTIEDKTIS